MAAGTSLAVVMAALETALEARGALSGVPVNDRPPVDGTDTQKSDGTVEAIWIVEADAPELAIPHLGVPVVFDESYDLLVVIQVIKPGGSGITVTQTSTTTRAVALLGEVIGTLASDPSLGIASTSELPWVEAIPGKWTHAGGATRGEGRGSRFELTVRVTARLQLT